MKKILWLIVIFLVLYVVAIFNVPIIAENIERNLGITGFNEKVIKFKGMFDDSVTDIPSQNEFQKTYSKALSGAIKVKTDVINGVDYTKNKIDKVRGTLSGAEDTLNKTVETINKAGDFIDEASQKINETKKVIDDVKDLTSSGAGN